MKIVYASRAAVEIEDILSYIHERNPQGAQKVEEAIRKIIHLLAQFPFMGKRTDEAGVRMIGTARYPYLIFYTVSEEREELYILSVRHGARQR